MGHYFSGRAKPQGCIRDVLNDRRSESRASEDRVVEVRIMKGLRRTVSAHLVQASLSGVRVRIDRPIPEGTPIEVLIGDEHVFGVVRNCVPANEQFNVGVLIRYTIRPHSVSA